MLGCLYIVATPIGNLGDISLRALDILKRVDYVLAEDTRQTKKLLIHYEIDIPLLSYHQHSSELKKVEILTKLLEGKNLALLTDAGTPGISDPGNELIDYILKQESNIKVIAIPGPSAVTAALSLCGFRAGEFTFLGYAPKKGRTKFMEEIKASRRIVVFFESPFRIVKLVNELISYLDEDRKIFIGQELTKLHERCLRGSLGEVKEALEKEQKELGRIKGELVVVI